MRAALRQFGWLLLVVSCAAGQDTPATLQGVKVVSTDNGIQVDVSLSQHVQPNVLTATNPDRLILDFPNTVASAKQERIPVNSDGVRAVRYGLNSARPAITRVVVDLDRTHLYEVKRNGTTVSLRLSSSSDTQAVRHVPPAAGSGGILDIFHRRGGPSSPHLQDADEALRRPIPGLAPAPKTTANSTPPSNPAPSPAHPSRGSLQEGTVFPGMGSPGTGSVPATVGDSRTTPAPATSSAPTGPTATVAPSTEPAGQTEVPLGTIAKQITAAPPAKSVPVASGVTPPPAKAPATETTTIAAVTVPKPPPVQAPAPSPGTGSAPAKVGPTIPPVRNTAAPTSAVPPAATTAPPASSPDSTSSETSSLSKPAPATTVQPQVAPALTVKTQSPAAASTESTTQQEDPAKAPATSATPPANQETTEIAVVTPPSVAPAAPAAPTESTPEVGDQAFVMVPSTDPNLKTVFRVKYVAAGVAYLDGGSGAGLAEGMKLEIKDTDLPVKQGATVDPSDPRIVAELEVSAVAETSAITDIHSPKRPVKVGDLAYLSMGDAQALILQRTMSPTRQYPVVVAFTDGDPMDEEVRKELPRPPQPSVNRARGRIGFDYMGTVSHDTPSSANSDFGMIFRADITRIAGTYWNLSGYWRGRLHRQSATTQPTLQDLINRTYHLGMFYDNPNSRMVAGVGRLYLPWAPSLDTIDGGYFGFKLGSHSTTGVFAGSTPDPTSWSYNPDRRIGGAFINFEGGDYDRFHYTSTSGMGISTLKWQIDRPFIFLENSLSYKRFLSIYDSLQADSPRGNAAVAAPGPGLSRNFLTVRVQVHPRVELDFNHNYLRDIPTYDPTLVGTGLLDKYLFQGASVGARIEVLKQVFLYTNIGSSNRTGDAKHALNELYGLTFTRMPWLGLRADAHYSRFSSAFADGSYRSFSLGRNMTEDLRLDILVGDQNYTSTLATSDRTRFVNANAEFSFGPRYFMQGGFTINRGQTQNYDQWLFTVGYRFDSKARHQ